MTSFISIVEVGGVPTTDVCVVCGCCADVCAKSAPVKPELIAGAFSTVFNRDALCLFGLGNVYDEFRCNTLLYVRKLNGSLRLYVAVVEEGFNCRAKKIAVVLHRFDTVVDKGICATLMSEYYPTDNADMSLRHFRYFLLGSYLALVDVDAVFKKRSHNAHFCIDMADFVEVGGVRFYALGSPYVLARNNKAPSYASKQSR